MRGGVGAAMLALVLVVTGAGCERVPEAPTPVDVEPAGPAPSTASSPAAPTATEAAPLGTVAPAWLGQRPLPRAANGLGEIRPTPAELCTRRFTLPDHIDPLPGDGFASKVEPVPDDVLGRSSWSEKCPVDAEDLRWVRLAFWGFDGHRHTGELLIHADVADAIVRVFEQLYADRFPIEEMRITRADEIDAEPTGDGNNTGVFTCRPIEGTVSWSEHARGRAIDVNPFQNPYIKPPNAAGVPGDMLIPELASAYLDRSRQVPGTIHPGDAVVQAFASIGWRWGGHWHKAKDYMHFSPSGR